MAMWISDSMHELHFQSAQKRASLKELYPLLRQSGAASATPRGLAARGAINEVPVIIAAVHLLVRGTEPTGVVGSAERARTPSLMDTPDTTTTNTGEAATSPSARPM